MIEERASLLKVIDGAEHGVSELTELAGFRRGKTIALLEAMEQEGLIQFLETSNERKRGRPKKISRITPLGERFLSDFRKCRRNLVQINNNDIKRCVHQIALKRVLENNNISPYQRFLELNEFAFSIRDSVVR